MKWYTGRINTGWVASVVTVRKVLGIVQMTSAQKAPIPEFGVKQDGIDYIDRPGVYAVIQNNDKQIAVIETRNGYFLPGGGIDVIESDVDALKREIFEEIGYQATVLEVIGEAVEYIKSYSDGKAYKIRSRFYKVQLGSKVGEGVEKDYRLVWLWQENARRLLVRQSQAWAIQGVVKS
jgi:8-oxo-dGTP diphosphatase